LILWLPGRRLKTVIIKIFLKYLPCFLLCTWFLPAAVSREEAVTLYNQRNYTEASRAFEELFSAEENPLYAWYLVKILIDKNELESALKKTAFFLEKFPDDQGLLYHQARVYVFQNKYSLAAEVLEKIITQRSTNAHYFNLLGFCYIETGRFKEAVLMLNMAISLDSTVKEFFNNLGAALERLGNYRESARAYLKALTIDPAYKKANENFERVAKLISGQP